MTNPSIALITGGSRGLGKSAALHLADRGVDSIITYVSNADAAKDVVRQIEAKGRKAAALQLDAGKVSTFGAFVEALRGKLTGVWKRDRIDFLVNNAGTGMYVPFAETSEAQFDELMNVHLKGPYFLSQKLLPLINDGGRILNVSSGLTRMTQPGSSAYATMKAGVEVLTRYMAKELGARKITVNVLAPGAIATDFGGGRVRDNPEINCTIAGLTALGRVGEPDDIGLAVSMLLARESRWINGQRVEASGGQGL